MTTWRKGAFLQTVFLLLLLIESRGQMPPPIQWQQTIGGTAGDQLYSLRPTADGGYVLGGASASGLSGVKTSMNYGGPDYWVVRLDGSGAKLWERSYGGSSEDVLLSIHPTADGGFILGGGSSSTNSGNKTSVQRGGFDWWLVRLDASGNKVWEQSYGGNGYELLWSLWPTADGGFVLGGQSSSGVSGNKTSLGFGNSDFWVLRVDASGNKVWDQSFGGSGPETIYSVQPTSDGGYIVGGHSSSPISGNKTNASFGASDYWIVRLNPEGNRIWDRVLGGNGVEFLYSVRQTSDDGFVLAGASFSGISGNKTNVNLGGLDFWIVRLNAQGGLLWQKSFGGTDDDEPNWVAETSEGGFIVAGYSYSAVSGNKTSPGRGLADFWVVRLDARGNKLWDQSFGGAGYDFSAAVLQTPDRGFVLGGYSTSGMSGNKTSAGYGAEDFWVIKLGPDLPRLTMARAGTDLRVSWPDWGAGFRLERGRELAAPAWGEIAGNLATNNGTVTATIPVTNRTGFFRLRK